MKVHEFYRKESQLFTLGAILNMTTGVVISPEAMNEMSSMREFIIVWHITRFMDGLDVTDDDVREWIFAQYPEFRKVVDPKFRSWAYAGWLKEQEDKFGEKFSVKAMFNFEITLSEVEL